MNARFWTESSRGCWTKVTLRLGQTLYSAHRERTSEGFFSCGVAWSFEGEFVTMNERSRSRDCDGVRITERMQRCHILYLRWYELATGWGVIETPKWTEVTRTQRDLAAEAMGY